MGSMLSRCGCICDTDDPPPCDPQPLRISSTNGCFGSLIPAGSLPVRVTVTNPLGVVVYDGRPPDNGYVEIADTMLGVYTWTAEAYGCAAKNFVVNPSGSVTVRCKNMSVPAGPFSWDYAYIWPGAARQRDSVCPCAWLNACGIKIEGGRTLSWYGGSVSLAPYPVTEGNLFPLEYFGGPYHLPSVQEGNVWAGVQRYDGACCVLPAGLDPWLPGAPFRTCPQAGNAVDLLWVWLPYTGSSCRIDCYAMHGTTNPLVPYSGFPVATSISQAGTSIEIPGSGGMRVWFGLSIVGSWGSDYNLDPPPEFEPDFIQFSGGYHFPTSFAPPDPRIFGYLSSGYYAGTPTCLAVPQFPITVTE